MATLKDIKRYPDTNSVEATWVDGEVVVKCHSYDQVQMDMLAADLGADLVEYQWVIDEVNANFIPVPPAPIIIPQSVTMRQARLQLLALGKLAEVETAIAGMGDAAKITWEFSSVVERNNPLVASMQALLGWTDTQMDEMFITASQL